MVAERLLLAVLLAGAIESNGLDITSVDASECQISGITVGSSYDDVIEALGDPEEENLISDPKGNEPKSRHLKYHGLSVGTVHNLVTALLSNGPDHSLAAGIGPRSTHDDVLDAYGETNIQSSDRREVLSYRCKDSRHRLGETLLLITMTEGVVEAVALALKTEP
jgi:hypothetical protein